MNYLKINTSLKIILLSLLFTCCNQKKQPIEIKDASLPKSVLPKMKPLTNEPLVSEKEVHEIREKIIDFYKKKWVEKKVNGTILIAKNGQIIFERYLGIADINKRKNHTKNTPLHIASVSKVMTASAILKLINAKRIDLDQPVCTILNEFPFPEITIRMLLNHRSGLRNYVYFTDRDKSIWDKKNILTNQDILTLLATKDIGLESQPDTRFAYCNTNYALLALIIEKVTKMRYKEAMTEMIFKPLGMKHTFVFDYYKDKDSIIPSYNPRGMEIGKDYLDAVYGDKNIYSTPRDLLKFDRARNRPDFLEPDLLNQVYTGHSNEHVGKRNYGLGIRMIKWENGSDFFFHNGWWHGNTSSYITLQKEQVTIIALSNRMTKFTYKVKEIASYFGNYPFEIEEETP